MNIDIWLTIIIIAAIVWCWIGYEAYNSPIMPADYENKPTGKQKKKKSYDNNME